MKILQISFHTAPFGSVGKYDSGGLNIYVEKISDQLSKNNHVTIVTGEKAESFVKDNLEFKSLNLFDKDLSVEDKEIYLQEFINKLNESVNPESFDVIHAHYWLSGLVGREIANKFNKPLVYTSHSLGIFLDGYNKERVDCEKIIMTSSDIITTSSLFEEDLILKNYNVVSDKIKLITPGVDGEIFTPDSTLKRENIFLSIGRIQEQKGQIETIKFLDNFRKVESNFICYFVGGPSGKSGNEYFEELKKTVVDLNLESHVEFHDNLPQIQIRDLLNKSKLLIHTSKFETFGLVAAEANAMGVPVLTTNSGSLLEIVESNENGYYSESLIDGNVNNFVKELLNNNDKFYEIMLNCLDKSKAYSWANTAREIEILYKDIA
jgi:glycosyltransferase involved in cell wall biosynthesis